MAAALGRLRGAPHALSRPHFGPRFSHFPYLIRTSAERGSDTCRASEAVIHCKHGLRLDGEKPSILVTAGQLNGVGSDVSRPRSTTVPGRLGTMAPSHGPLCRRQVRELHTAASEWTGDPASRDRPVSLLGQKLTHPGHSNTPRLVNKIGSVQTHGSHVSRDVQRRERDGERSARGAARRPWDKARPRPRPSGQSEDSLGGRSQRSGGSQPTLP